jgi:hypothetical protein
MSTNNNDVEQTVLDTKRRICMLPNNAFGVYYVVSNIAYFRNVVSGTTYTLQEEKANAFYKNVKWQTGKIDGYSFSTEPFIHPVFQTKCLSAYPIDNQANDDEEVDTKVHFQLSTLPNAKVKKQVIQFAFDNKENASSMVQSILSFSERTFESQTYSQISRAIDYKSTDAHFSVKSTMWSVISEKRENVGLLPYEVVDDISKKREREVKYARPTLDLEFIQGVGPCVRCYLTLTDRPRPNSKDKDITQDVNGKITLSNVNLMNFGTPLRALTWIEDYYKNPEHGSGRFTPLLRSFLIPLDNYFELIEKTTSVDMDRATGQVRLIEEVISAFKPVDNSLVTFSDHQAKPEDGTMKKIEDLAEFVIGERIHPNDFSDIHTNSHQHNRTVKISSQTHIHCAFFKTNSKVKGMIEAQSIEASYREVRPTVMKNSPSKHQ